MGEGESTPTAMVGTAVAEEAGTPVPTAATEEEAVTEMGTSAREATAAAAAKAEVPAPEVLMGAGMPASVVATKGEAATGTLAPTPASKVVAPTGEPAAASTGAGAHASGPSVRPAASGMVLPVLMAASRSAPASALATPVPKAWRGSVLRWSSRDKPQRPLFTLDDAAEWGKWQALQGSLANVRAALSSTLGELDDVVFPGGQVTATQQVINDLQRREQAAQEDARRAEAKFKKTVERIWRERQKAWQDWATERVRKEEANKVAANLGAEVSQLQVQAWELQASVAQGLDRERQLKAQSEGELARLRELLDAERGEHGDLRDAVRIVCDGLGVVQGEGTSSLATRVVGMYRRAHNIAVEALHTGVR
nr:male-specific lethal 1 homolog [Setaria viridis]